MYCKDIQSCFYEINAYCTGQSTGRALLVNTENYTVYQDIKMQLEADSSKNCVYVSKCCPENELPDMDDILGRVTGCNDYVLIGYSQAGMLRSSEFLDQMLGTLLEIPVKGHTVVLLEHCEQYVKRHFSVHPDIQKRVLLLEGQASKLPRIRLADNERKCIGYSTMFGIKHLLAYFERLTDEKVVKNPEVVVITKYSPELFKKALFSVSACDDTYASLQKKYTEVAAGTERKYGTEKQWEYLAEKLDQYGTISAIAENLFGSTVNLAIYIGQVFEENNADKYWLLWLCMKIFGNTGNRYLGIIMQNSTSVADFEEHIYLGLLKIRYDDAQFRQCYTERKRLIDMLPENLNLQDLYCSKIGIYQKDSIYYLTDTSEKEELAFMQCLETYDYSEDELLRITEAAFPAIYSYLQKFTFNVTNTKVPAGEEELRDTLTKYFEKYKRQKLTNRIYPDFLQEVEQYATERPYNKLQARSTIISKMDRSNAQLYFFDALGVEYLGFIQEKCEHYGLVIEISIGRCELPSITNKNKEFLHFFPSGAFDIKKLDELKHHSQVIDYNQCKEPIHLFRELEIIDDELKKIQSGLKQGHCEKAVFVSDHGASRLAVIYEQENEKLELEEKGKHSGRCCPAKEDPQIPYVSYWDGYAVLANYERFKGGRKANVEVHGGASMEEVVVPIITLTKKPADIDICFVDSVVTLKGREPAAITVYSNIPLHAPKLIVNERVYIGEFCEDSKHAKFIMPEMKRTKDWFADFYDGDKKLASEMEFHVQKNTQEQSLFKKKPF